MVVVVIMMMTHEDILQLTANSYVDQSLVLHWNPSLLQDEYKNSSSSTSSSSISDDDNLRRRITTTTY